MKSRTIDWPAVAEKVAAAIPVSRLHPAVQRWADGRPPREKWGVAFSGGADSLTLLLLLWALWPSRRGALRVLHFDHRLRGGESRADAAFCRKVCAALGLAFEGGVWEESRPAASEAAAREARMTFMAGRAKVLWFGHQQDDIAETMLMRLARGSGAGGLAAPRPVQAMPRGRVHLRPLLSLKKAELGAALQAAGGEWREDGTNRGARFFRNRIRATVVPAWATAAARDALAGAARSRELLEEDDTALDAWLAELPLFENGGVLRVDRLQGKPRALARRALHRWLGLQPHAGELSRQAFDALLDAVTAGRTTRQSLGALGFARIRQGRLSFERQRKSPGKFQRRAN